MLRTVVSNPLINIGVLSWLIAQLIKTIRFYIQNRFYNWHQMIAAGGMPSAHSAFVGSIVYTAWRLFGFSSPIFAVLTCFGCVVIYDAMGVRWAAGRHAEAINIMKECLLADPALTEGRKKELLQIEEMDTSLGHRPREVLAGLVLGVLIAFLCLDVFHLA
jgi:acid phosphatase family membrane protein YuiD